MTAPDSPAPDWRTTTLRTPMADDRPAPAPRAPRAVTAPPPPPVPTVPASVQLADKLGEIVAVLAFCALAYVGKLSGEWAVVASLTALGVQSIPRGILAARSGGPASGEAALGLIGLGLLAAMHAGDGREPPRHPPTPPTTTMVGLVALLALGLAGCSPAAGGLGWLALAVAGGLAVVALLRRPTRVIVVGPSVERRTAPPFEIETDDDPPRPTMVPPLSGQSGSATVGALVVLAALALVACAVLQGCPRLPPVSGCEPGTQRCEGDRPEVCSATGRWHPVGDLSCAAVGGRCAVGLSAHCVPADGGVR